MSPESFHGVKIGQANPDERPSHSLFSVETFRGHPGVSEDMLLRAESLYKEGFEPIYQEVYPTRDITPHVDTGREQVRTHFMSPTTQIILLKDTLADDIVGYTMAFPAIESEMAPPYTTEKKRLKLSAEEYAGIQGRTVEVGVTVIDPNHQNKGGWEMMMDALDEHVIASGVYDYMVRHVRVTEGYAFKVKKRYQGKVLYGNLLNSDLGKQLYMRIDLKGKH